MKALTIGSATIDRFVITNSNVKIEDEANSSLTLTANGEKVGVDKVEIRTGGGATNSAVAFKKLGIKTSCFCQVGSDSDGEKVIKELKEYGIDTAAISKSEEHQTGSSFIISSNGKHLIFVARNANSHINENQIPLATIKESSFLYITSLGDSSSNLMLPILKCAKENNIKVAFNPGKSQLGKSQLEESQLRESQLSSENSLIQKALPMTTILILNFRESMILSKTLGCPPESRQLDEIETLKPLVKKVLETGVKLIVVTAGEKGVFIGESNSITHHQSLKGTFLNGTVVDTVGAGDSFGSVFSASIFKGLSSEKSAQRGLVSSRSVISQIGAKPGLLKEEKLEEEVARTLFQPCHQFFF
jgi:ribokinase